LGRRLHGRPLRLLSGVPCAAETRQTGRLVALVQVRRRSTTSDTPTPPCCLPTACRTTSRSTPAWAARLLTASPRCSRVDSRHEASPGEQGPRCAATAERPGLLICRYARAMQCPRGDTAHTHTPRNGRCVAERASRLEPLGQADEVGVPLVQRGDRRGVRPEDFPQWGRAAAGASFQVKWRAPLS
jgi:hypothetical protein